MTVPQRCGSSIVVRVVVSVQRRSSLFGSLSKLRLPSRSKSYTGKMKQIFKTFLVCRASFNSNSTSLSLLSGGRSLPPPPRANITRAFIAITIIHRQHHPRPRGSSRSPQRAVEFV
eukprot:scaffold6065_cov154-Skeletonema_menzelii.AAC.3